MASRVGKVQGLFVLQHLHGFVCHHICHLRSHIRNISHRFGHRFLRWLACPAGLFGTAENAEASTLRTCCKELCHSQFHLFLDFFSQHFRRWTCGLNRISQQVNEPKNLWAVKMWTNFRQIEVHTNLPGEHGHTSWRIVMIQSPTDISAFHQVQAWTRCMLEWLVVGVGIDQWDGFDMLWLMTKNRGYWKKLNHETSYCDWEVEFPSYYYYILSILPVLDHIWIQVAYVKPHGSMTRAMGVECSQAAEALHLQ